jgi:hypothetical protein
VSGPYRHYIPISEYIKSGSSGSGELTRQEGLVFRRDL